MSNLFHDLRDSIRQLRKSPGFAITALRSLAQQTPSNLAFLVEGRGDPATWAKIRRIPGARS